MQLHIRHETRYEYEGTVNYSIQSLKLTPRSEPAQRVISWRICAPGERIEQIDPYGNVTHVVTVESPHRELRIAVDGIVDVMTQGDDAERLPPLAGELSPLAFLWPTPLTQADATIREIADRHLGRHPPSRTSLMDLVAGVQQALRYEPGVTDAGLGAIEAVQLGSGVCQDQAHVYIACCRAAGVPARYVSG